MAASNICWGIELGAGSIKALKLQTDGDNLKVLDFIVIPHKKVLSTPELDQGEAIRVALGELVSQKDLTGASIAVSVPGNSAFARFAKLPPVEPKKIPDIVRFEAIQQIPFPIDEVEWDYQTFANKDSPDVEVGIFAMRRESVMEKLATWADVGITPDYVTLSPIAAFNAIAYDMNFSEKTPGTVILDVGATSTDLIVAEAGRVWVRTFPIGGHQFTEALVEAFKLSYSKAEALKKTAEQSKHARHVFQALRPVFSDLTQDVQRSIGYYQSLHRDANLTRMIVLGSTFNLPGLKKYLGQQLQMEVVQLPQFARLSLDGPQSGEFQAATLNLATAYGLAIQGLGLNAINANLMPKAVLREAMWKGKTKWFGVAAGLSLVAGAASFLKVFVDGSKISASPRPTINDTTIGNRRDLDAKWKAVESSFVPDFKAANSMLLLDGRDIFPWLIDDLGQMMARAKSAAEKSAAKGGSPDGLMFVKYTTQFQCAGAEDFGFQDYGAAGSEYGAPPVDARPAGKVGAKAAAAPTPDPAAEAAAPPPGLDPKYGPAEGPPRVLCTLTVKTARPDVIKTAPGPDNPNAADFVTDTIQSWLVENRLTTADGRALVPYEIHHIKWTLLNKVDEIPADPAAPVITTTTQPRNSTPAGRDRRPGRTPDEGLDDDGKPHGPKGFLNDDTRLTNPSANPYQPGNNSGAGQGNVDALAPFPKPDPIAPPGTKIYYFEITWEAYIKKATTTPKEGA
ncbi:MAG: type IV pilus assembly protein PilM [Pyrinomonadaceae bacterium]|nr:type IV pilus assembly protein PilM [Phycisphaerales bacterium]